MAIDFPNSPTNGATYSAGGKTWIYSSATSSWSIVGLAPVGDAGGDLTGTYPNPSLATTALGGKTFTGTIAFPSTTSIGNVSSTEIGYLDGVTSALQTQLSGKLDTANPSGTGTFTLAGTGNAGIELGRTDGTSSTPYIDFHSSATAADYNVRLIASGGTGTLGSGTLTVTATTVTLPAGTSIGNVTSTEIGYVDGVTSGIQGQLDGKQATITGAATTITASNLTVSRALASDASGKVAVSAVTSTELGYLSGVTSALQTQLNAKASTTHASTHASAGSDPVTLAQSQITNLTTDLAAKQATITGAATTITSSNLTVSRALASDASGKVAVSAVTSTELGYLSGVTSALQTQISGLVSRTNGTVTTAATGSTVVRNITLSTSDPTGGTDGDVWLKYTA